MRPLLKTDETSKVTNNSKICQVINMIHYLKTTTIASTIWEVTMKALYKRKDISQRIEESFINKVI